MAKSLTITYVLWLFGGWFGLHHFYLGRDRQAVVWIMTLGGYFGLGWIRDLWRIPEYVKYANQDHSFLEVFKEKIRKKPKPEAGTVRSIGTMIVSDAFGYVILYALPNEYIPESLVPVFALLVPFAVSLGVHLVGNIGDQQGRLRPALVGAYLTYPLYWYSTHSVFWTCLVSSQFFSWYSREWRLTPERKGGFFKRFFWVVVVLSLYGSMWLSWAYFNCEITDSDGETVKCRESVRHFFTSPLWKNFKGVLEELYNTVKYRGWSELWREIMDALDPHGESNALELLAVSSSASQEEITAQYRRLSRQWHPDRFKNAEDKENAQEKFIAIQHAYETLSQMKMKRFKKNKEDRSNPDEQPNAAVKQEL